MSSIDKKAFGISDSLVNAVNEALKGGQVKLDKNHNGKIDGQDFKMLRKEENIDELSKKTLGSYVKKASSDAASAYHDSGVAMAQKEPEIRDANKAHGRKRLAGIKTATDKLTKEEVEAIAEGNPMNKEKKNAAAAAVGAKNKDSQYLTRIKPSVADKIRGREKMSGNDRKQFEEVEQVDELSGSLAHRAAHGAWIKTDKAKAAFKGQAKAAAQARKFGQYAAKKGYYDAPKKTNEEAQQVDELSTDTYHSAAKKAAKRAMGDAQGRSGPIFKKYAGMANKFRDKGMSQEKKEKAMKEETDPGFVAEADNAVAKQIAAKKDTFKKQLQQKIAAKQMNTMQAKANKRLSNIHASNDKCTCQEGKGKSMTCEMHGDKANGIKGGKEQIIVNPPMREAAELPKKVITKGHEIAKSIIKNRAGVDNPYAVGMAQAKKSAKMNAYRTDRDKNKED
jgi:hypothetical protein